MPASAAGKRIYILTIICIYVCYIVCFCINEHGFPSQMFQCLKGKWLNTRDTKCDLWFPKMIRSKSFLYIYEKSEMNHLNQKRQDDKSLKYVCQDDKTLK